MSVYDDLHALVEQAWAENAAVVTENVRLQAELTTAIDEIVNLKAQLEACQDPPPPPPPTDEYDAIITEGMNLNEKLAVAGAGAKVKVSGPFPGSMKPLSGQTIHGPFTLTGGNGDAVNLKSLKAENVTIEDIHIEHYGGRGVVPWKNTTLRHFEIFDCTGNGMTGSYDNQPNMGIVLEDGFIHGCGNQAGVGNNSGGVKFTRTGPPGAAPGSAMTIRRVEFSDNIGGGLWFDITAAGILVEDVVCKRNSTHGLHWEISAGPCEVNGAILQDNRGHGLFIVSSALFDGVNIEVGGNGGRGILVLEEERAILDYPAVGGTHEGFHLLDIKLLNYVANGDEIRGTDHPAVTAVPA